MDETPPPSPSALPPSDESALASATAPATVVALTTAPAPPAISPGPPTLASRLTFEVALFAAFTLLAFVMLWPLANNMRTHIAEVGIRDPLMATRLFRAAFDWLLGSASLTDIDIFYPHPNVYGTTDHCIGSALIVLPFRLFTDDMLLLVNLSTFLTFPLSAHGAYTLARQFTPSRAAAALSGVAFAFCFYRFHQLDHVTILQMQWLPYSLAFLHRLRDNPSAKNAALFALFFFLNGLSSPNVALYTMPIFPLVAIWALITANGTHRARFALTLAVATFVAILALAPFFLPYLEADAIYKLERGVGQQINWSARVEQFIAAPRWSLIYGASWSKYLGSESATFLGFTVLSLATLGVASLFREPSAGKPAACSRERNGEPDGHGERTPPLFRDRVRTMLASPRVLYLFIAVIFAVLALGPEIIYRGERWGAGLFATLSKIPAFGSTRTPARFFFVTSLAVALLAGSGAGIIFSRVTRRSVRAALAFLAIGAVVLESWVAPIPATKLETLAEAPPVYKWLAEQPGKAPLLELPVGADHRAIVRRYHMYFSNLHKRPTVDDCAGHDLPVLWWVGASAPAEGRLAFGLERLRVAGVEFVVLHRAEIAGNDLPAYIKALDAQKAPRVAEFGPDLVFSLPATHAAPVAFSQNSALADLEIPASGLPGSKFVVRARFMTTGDAPVFERRALRLTLRMTLTINGRPETRVKAVYLAPPLILPASDAPVAVELALPQAQGTFPALFVLSGRDGLVWAERRTSITIAHPTILSEIAGRAPETACQITVTASRRLASGGMRLLYRIDNTGESPWAGAAIPELRVSAVAGSLGAATAITTLKLAPIAPGTATGGYFELSDAASPLHLAVVYPLSGRTACTTSFPIR